MSKISLQGRLKAFVSGDMKQAGVLAMDIVILILTALFTVSIITFVVCMIEERDTGYSEGAFYSRVCNREYGQICSFADENRYSGIGVGMPNMEEYYAVADYYKAGFYRRMYEVVQNQERITFWSEREENAEKRMGILSPEKQNIDGQLENEIWKK